MSIPRCVVNDPQALARLAADRVIAEAARAIAARGHFSLVLSGGSTPKALYRLLGDEPKAVDWSKVDLYFGDERCVPPEHADSNYRTAKDALFDRANIDPARVFRMRGEGDPVVAAAEYDALLRGKGIGAGAFFDVVLLGMGGDGHTASLFPETKALDVHDRLVTENYVEKLSTNRITMTPKALLAARSVIFLMAGADKAEVLRDVLEGEPRPRLYPSQLIFRAPGPAEILADRAATAKLS